MNVDNYKFDKYSKNDVQESSPKTVAPSSNSTPSKSTTMRTDPLTKKQRKKSKKNLAPVSDDESGATPKQKHKNSTSKAATFSPGRGGVAGQWSDKIAEKKQTEHNQERAKVEERHEGGLQFVDKQIRLLISELKKQGSQMNFGALFDRTQDSMPALAATLNVAKKRGVVQYEGDMLMQGSSDDVIIYLLKDKIEDTKATKRRHSAHAVTAPAESGTSLDDGPSPCYICSKTVYPVERVVANQKVMHKACFRCCQCNGILKLAKYAFGNGKFFCETHFQQNFLMTNGYQF